MEVYEKAPEHEPCGLFVYLCVSQLSMATPETKNLSVTVISSSKAQLLCFERSSACLKPLYRSSTAYHARKVLSWRPPGPLPGLHGSPFGRCICVYSFYSAWPQIRPKRLTPFPYISRSNYTVYFTCKTVSISLPHRRQRVGRGRLRTIHP